MRRATLAAVAGLVIVTILVVAVLAGRDIDQEATAGGRFGPVHSALCAARSAVARGETAEARRLFVDHAHERLHELAATAGDTDRAAAARLLEAKEAVERDFATASAELARDLDGLISNTSKAIAVAGQAQPAPCADEENFEKSEVNPAAKEWISPAGVTDAREPWVFVVGRDGRVTHRFDNVATDAELEAAAQDVLA